MGLSLITFVAGTKIKSSEFNSNNATIVAELFDIDENNLSAGCQIPDNKLAVISSTNKVNGSALVSETIDAAKGQFVWYIDGTIAVTTGISAVYTASCNLIITGCHLEIKTAPSGSALIVDINKNGSTIWTTRPQIDDGATSGDSTALSVTTLASGDDLTLDVDQVGSSTPGSGLTVMLRVDQKVPQ